MFGWFTEFNADQKRGFSEISTTGFPNRADVGIRDFSLSLNRFNIAIYAELTQLLSSVYCENHFINITKPPIELKIYKKRNVE